MIQIGELAKKVNISKRTLHYYEQIGLLKPTLVSENGYRYYDEYALFHLLKILLLKSVGYTLKQIKELIQSQNSANENEYWIASLSEQIELIEKKKEELGRKQYYLRSTIHTIQLKGKFEVSEVLKVIRALDDRPIVDGVVPAEFGNDLPLTRKETDILKRLPVLGSKDKRLEDILAIYQQIQDIMHQPPNSPEAQILANELHNKSLELFEGNVNLLDKYWELIRPRNDEEPVVMGMDAELMSYIDEMIIFFLNQREEEENEET